MPEKKKDAQTGKPVKSEEKSGQEGGRKLYRSRTERMLGGVCGGFAEYLDLDPTLVRVIWVLSCFINGLGLLAYVVSWIVIPENPHQSAAAAEAGRSKNSAFIVGVVLIALGLFFLSAELDIFDGFFFDWSWQPLWVGLHRLDLTFPLLLIFIGVIYLIAVNRKQEQNATTKKSPGGNVLEKKLTRSIDDKMIGGVCGGLARYFNIDASIVRIAWALLTIWSGIFLGVIAYIVMLVIIPEESSVPAQTGGSEKGTAKTKSQKK